MNKKGMRILAIILAVALIGTTLLSVIFSGRAEEAPTDRYEISIEFSEDTEALQIAQRLFYTNNSGTLLDRLMLSVYPNIFRRSSTIFYEDDSAFPSGYAPAGIEFLSVKVDGKDVNWAMQGAGECFMRIEASLEPYEACEVYLEYALLLSENDAFLGYGVDEIRLSAFFPVMCPYENGIWEANEPLQQTNFVYTTLADYEVTITLPDIYDIAATGNETRASGDNGLSVWTVSAQDVREFSMIISRAWHRYEGMSLSGVSVSVLSSDRLGGRFALDTAIKTIDYYEELFGEFPVDSVDIASSGYAYDSMAGTGNIWINDGLFGYASRDELSRQIWYALAQQYFGLFAYVNPVTDAWLRSSLSSYVSCMALERFEGEEAFRKVLSGDVADSINITMPSDLFITSPASAFTQAQFNTVVINLGIAAINEIRSVTGDENFASALKTYCSYGVDGKTRVETDFVKAFDAVTSGDNEAFITDALFNITDYSKQTEYGFD